MQRLEVSGAERSIYASLGFKGLIWSKYSDYSYKYYRATQLNLMPNLKNDWSYISTPKRLRGV